MREQLDRFEARLAKIETQLLSSWGNVTSEERIQSKILDKKITQLKAEFLLLFESSVKIQDSVINSTKNSHQQAIDSAVNFVYWLIYTATAIIALGGVIITWKGIESNRIIQTAADESKKAEAAAKKALDYAKETKSTISEANNVVQNNIQDVQKLHKEMTSLHLETKTLHQLMDFRENYRRHRAKEIRESKEEEALIKQASEIINEIKALDESFDNNANISYLASILGVLYYFKNMLSEAYSAFSLSKETNVKNLIDRPYNLACVTAKLYLASNKQVKEYFEISLNNYKELDKDKKYQEILRDDKDFKGIITEIDDALRE